VDSCGTVEGCYEGGDGPSEAAGGGGWGGDGGDGGGVVRREL